MAAALNETVVCCVQAALPLAVYVSCVEGWSRVVSLCRLSCARASVCYTTLTKKRSYIYLVRVEVRRARPTRVRRPPLRRVSNARAPALYTTPYLARPRPRPRIVLSVTVCVQGGAAGATFRGDFGDTPPLRLCAALLPVLLS